MIWYLGTGKPKLGIEKNGRDPGIPIDYTSLFVNYKKRLFLYSDCSNNIFSLGQTDGHRFTTAH